MDLPAITPSPAPAEETSNAASIIPTADRDQWLDAIEAQTYLRLSPTEYAALCRDGTIKHDGRGVGTRLHSRAELRDLLVRRLGESEAAAGWARLERHWQQEDQAYLESFAGRAEAAQRKAAGLPAPTGYQRRADPLADRPKAPASADATAAPAPAPRAESRPYLTAQESLAYLRESQQRQIQQGIAARQQSIANRATALSTAGLRRSKMSADQKAEFLDKFGRAEYLKLPM